MSLRFHDRRDAGRQLAAQLRSRGYRDPIVLGLPRGGVPVAFEVALALDADLDVFVVRKLGVPGQEELAMGAIASGGVRVLMPDVVKSLRISEHAIEQVAAREAIELERREAVYRGHRPFPHLRGRTVIIVDDGVATGASMTSAIQAVRVLHAAHVVAAAPVIAADSRGRLLVHADECEAIAFPEDFIAVGAWYEEFQQTTDAEVTRLLHEAAGRVSQGGSPPDGVIAIGARE